jgi:glyoxylase-like metal-dependent hydrolase (beta-lactamase superfamily II)
VPDAISWGDMRIAAVIDWAGEVPEAIGLLPGTSRTDWEQHQGWLSRIGLWDPATNRRALSVHSWVLQTDGMTVVVDTGAGNGKDRPGQPLFAWLSTLYPENLARSGVQPEDVDIVINTHLHADHVGWNTRSHDGHWVPTFPNARYVLPGPDVEYWEWTGRYMVRHSSDRAAAGPALRARAPPRFQRARPELRRPDSCLHRRPLPFTASGHRAKLGKLLRRGRACGRGVQAAGLVAGC